MRAFAVGAGQTADFGRSPRAVPLGSLDIFAGPVTPTRPRHLGVIKQGTAKGNNAGTQNAQNGAQICTRSPSASPAPAGVLRVLRSCVFQAASKAVQKPAIPNGILLPRRISRSIA